MFRTGNTTHNSNTYYDETFSDVSHKWQSHNITVELAKTKRIHEKYWEL